MSYDLDILVGSGRSYRDAVAGAKVGDAPN
jgi:hypothetical protein